MNLLILYLPEQYSYSPQDQVNGRKVLQLDTYEDSQNNGANDDC